MGVARTACGDKAQNLGLIELYGLGRCQIVRCQDNRYVGVDTALNCTHQDANNAVGNVLNVGCACLHVAVVHCCEHLSELHAGIADSSLCIQVITLDQALNGFYVIEVIEHHLVGFEQDCCLFARLVECLFVQLTELADRGCLRSLEACPFNCRISVGHTRYRAGAAAVEIQRADSHAAGYALAIDRNHHYCSPSTP